ncbi:MAG: hypothetical protein ACJAY8_000002 [Sphingobacteriales bacterium]|jgi:hypothetical protein
MKLLNRIATVGLILGVGTGLSAREYKPGTYKSKTQVNRNLKIAGCAPASAVAQMNFNNVRARLENGGALWQDRGNSTPAYFVPASGNVASIYSGALWMGGKSPNGQLKLAGVTFRRGNDYWPGPLTEGGAEIDGEMCDQWDKIFEISKVEAAAHKDYYDAVYDDAQNQTETVQELFPNGYTPSRNIIDWPAHGDVAAGQNFILAPFEDHPSGVGQEGLYEPELGDYPGYDLFGSRDCRENERSVPLFGDKTNYWIFNDKGNIHTETSSEPIGMEIRAQAFSFSDNTEINNMTFYNYVLINQGSQLLTETYFGQWVDSDLGNPADDFVGCDVARGLGYSYNGDENDEVNGGQSPGYGTTPPAIGIDFFEGPFQDDDGKDNVGPYKPGVAEQGIPASEMNYNIAKTGDGIPYIGLGIGYGDSIIDNERFGMRKFLFHNIGSGVTADPIIGQDYYNYMNGIWKDGKPFIYGGNAHDPNTGADPSQLCDFMFPGSSDPIGWGTQGNLREKWTENTANNATGDRRFMQSAGPFTLKPGAVNNITVGVVWARATAGGAQASISSLLTADDKAQALFDGCFQILEGPDAPKVAIRELKNELILTLTNPKSSNNYLELYSMVDPQIPELDSLENAIDNTYDFEGYLIYQVKDGTVSVADLENINLSRLIFQCDIENFRMDSTGTIDLNQPIDKIVNYTYDPDLGLPVPELTAQGGNDGIRHTFKINEDLFATGANRKLVNNKPYYFMAIAYGYNNYENYDPINFTGQAIQYLASRKAAGGGAIRPVSGIPHQIENQDGGTISNSVFGGEFEVTCLEGAGNGSRHVELKQETKDKIMAGPPWRTQELKYERGFGPIDVKIVDPLSVKRADFSLKILPPENPGPFEEIRLSKTIAKSGWELTDKITGTVITSSTSIGLGNEEFLVDYGISLKIDQVELTNYSVSKDQNEYGKPLFSSVEFDNPGNVWMMGVADEEGESRLNWIRSGQAIDVELSFPDEPDADPDEEFERIIGGTWTAARVAGKHNEGPLPDTNWYKPRDTRSSYNSSVDIVLTADRSKWSRVPVIELGPDTNITVGKAVKGKLRTGASLDKFGNANAEGKLTNGAPTPFGMSWFPGYAIDLETGERLNMAFGENSTMRGENGDDMIWNPGSNLTTSLGGSILGGGFHYIYVFRNQQRVLQDIGDGVPGYDAGLTIWEMLQGSSNDLRDVWSSVMYIGFPLTLPGVELDMAGDFIPNGNGVTFKIRVEKPYIRLAKNATLDIKDEAGSQNQWYPMYEFNTFDEVATVGDIQVVKNNLHKIQIVPNPYYAYSEYEGDRLDTRVKFTALPKKCTISIYSINGTLVRRLTKDNSSTIVEWDLKNHKTIPIASGAYLIHIDVPEVGERIIKWFATMRQVDLENL